MHAESFHKDPKHLGFVLARYKFVGRMLVGKRNALEVGCGDGTGMRVVRQFVPAVMGIDKRPDAFAACEHTPHDICDAPFPRFEAAYSLDVIEHVHPRDEDRFLRNIILSLELSGVFIVGTPSAESQTWASEDSIREHVNCKTETQLRDTLRRHFRNVFIFGMNDETLHTGYGPMCHYRLGVCTT